MLFFNCKIEGSIAGPGSSYKSTDTATFATGCFWCTEAMFKQLKGVVKIISGYTGGHVVNPSYKQVSTGTTGHEEACNIIYDPSQISYDELYNEGLSEKEFKILRKIVEQ